MKIKIMITFDESVTTQQAGEKLVKANQLGWDAYYKRTPLGEVKMVMEKGE